MTAPRLTLSLPPDFGSKEIQVDSKRFSIGRTDENDLVLDDSSLSRRHALIENYDGIYNLSDCGSSNGTLINGRTINSATVLSDWDVLTFGGVGDILVRIKDDAQPSVKDPNESGVASAPYSAATLTRNTVPRAPTADPAAWLTAPVIAVAGAVLILLVAGLILLLSQGRSNERRGTKQGNFRTQPTPVESNDNGPNVAVPTPIETNQDVTADATPGGSDDTDSPDLSQIEAGASKLLSSISRDTSPVLTDKPLKEINAQVQRYRNSSSLGVELRAMKRDLSTVSAAAHSNGLRPSLVVCATLAVIDKDGGRGEPGQVAGSIASQLAKMRRIFGDELANDSLLSVAALEEGPSLQFRITKLAGRVNDSPTTIRSIWYLHEHQIISDETYNFVLRFIAIGVIARDPQKFGISAEPLTF